MPTRFRENTLPGFALALDLGADGLELDVHATRDGVAIVHHDPTLADGSEIALLSRAELAQREAAPGVPIPTLAEVCDVVQTRAALYVEIKAEGIEAAVMRVLARHPGEVAIHSFDHALIGRLYRAGCAIPLGVLFEDDACDLDAVLAATGARDIWPHFSLVTPALVGHAHAAGRRVIAWTVNDADVARSLVDAGVDGLCGDDITILPARVPAT